MYTIEKFYEYEEGNMPFSHDVLDFYIQNGKDKKIACLDIETTGLSPSKSKFILGALLIFTEKGYMLKQYFAENLSQEKQLLEIFIDEIKKIDILLTYNGKNFDIKYLKEKMREHGVYADYNFPLNLDIYLFVDKFSPLRKFLPNLKQKTLENFMGIWDKRSDRISGGESVERYFNYLESNSEDIRNEIMLHNSDDVLQLARLFPVLKKCELDRAFYKLDCPLGFVIKEKLEIKNKTISISGYTREKSIPYICYSLDEHTCKFKISENDNFELQLPLIRKNDMDILNLKLIDEDFSALDIYENYAQGYLLIKKSNKIYYKSILHALKIVFERLEKIYKK